MVEQSRLLTVARARAIVLRAQRLDEPAPFGDGPAAVRRAVEHLGYVQIDTIAVIERSHHHILYSRIPDYVRADLTHAQTAEKSVFEYWTHALAYVPTADYRFFVPAMERFRAAPTASFATVDADAYAALLARIRTQGALSIRDIDDDVLVEKTHLWDSRKPSRNVLRLGFFNGDLTIGKRAGMLKTYDLAERHFGWRRRPKPATEGQVAAYVLERAIRAQGIVGLDSICFGNLGMKKAVAGLIETAVRRKRLVSVHIEGHDTLRLWATPAALDEPARDGAERLVHILSPFDPLVIQRKRLHLLFGYDHRFEAYVPAAKRVLGYFALPVLLGDTIVAVLDLKTDRQAGRLVVRKWTWIVPQHAGLKRTIEQAMARFERFQLA